MTHSRSSFVVLVILVFSAVALIIPQAARAQAGASAAAVDLTPPANAQKTASGLAYVVVTPGSGTVKPTDTDLVKVATSFWSKDSKNGEPGSFGAPNKPMEVGDVVVPGLREGLKLMTTGEKIRLWLPEALAFGGAAGKPAGPLLVELVLLDVVPAPTVPPDVAAPARDAVRTQSGLYSKVLTPGTGTVHPKASNTVKVHYTGWTTDGKRFDSSVVRGVPATFPLENVIAGWTEGVQLMVVGEKRRFWIPGKLAYDGVNKPGVPHGMLVFDIELLDIQAKK
jgi:peptidylprolyl isomerase